MPELQDIKQRDGDLLPADGLCVRNDMRVYGAASEGGSQWAAAHEANTFLSAVYGWMCIGLAITAATAWYVAASTALMKAVAANPGLFWGVIIIQFLIVFVLSARVQTLTAPVAAVLF